MRLLSERTAHKAPSAAIPSASYTTDTRYQYVSGKRYIPGKLLTGSAAVFLRACTAACELSTFYDTPTLLRKAHKRAHKVRSDWSDPLHMTRTYQKLVLLRAVLFDRFVPGDGRRRAAATAAARSSYGTPLKYIPVRV